MALQEIWTTELKNGIFRGITPTIDPFDETKFYISDGWGSTFPSMKLRRLSFENGQELNSLSIKNSVRCLYFNPDQRNLFVVSDNKIFQVDRASFKIIKKHEKGIQNYCDYISSNDKDTFLLMNRRSEFLFIYNYLEEKGIKKKLSSCNGIFKETENTFIIFCPINGTVQRYDLKTNSLNKILQTEVYCNFCKGNSGKLYFNVGHVVEETATTPTKIMPTNKMIIFSGLNTTQKEEITFEFIFDQFIISEKEDIAYLIKNGKVWIYSFAEKAVIREIQLNDKARIIQFFDKQQLMLSFNYDESNRLTCWRL